MAYAERGCQFTVVLVIEKRCGRLWGRAGRARADLGTGRGGGDRLALNDLLYPFAYRRCFDAAVSGAGRGSPIATHTLGSCCDWRLTNR